MKRILAFLLALVLVIGNLPAIHVHATEAEELPALEPVEWLPVEETEPVTEETEPVTEETVPETEPATEATEPVVEETEPETEATEPAAEATEPAAEEVVPEEPDVAVATTGVLGDFAYTVEADGVVITAYNGTATHLEVPAMIEDTPVVKIAAGVFGCVPSLTSIVFPDSITVFEASVLNNCENLKHVKLPKNLTTMGERCLEQGSNLVALVIGDQLTSVGEGCFGINLYLRHILYGGTQEQWEALNFSLVPARCTVHCQAKGDELVIQEKQTCTQKTVAHCQICNEDVYDVTFQGEHTYVDGICSVCGMLENALCSYDAELGGMVISSYYGTVTELVIPEMMDGYPVVKVGNNAFSNNTDLTKITLPDTLKIIGSSAFVACENLESIHIPASVNSLGSAAFYLCPKLKSVELPAGVTTIDHSMFNGCTALETVTIHGAVTKIGQYAFSGCESLKELQLPETVTEIENNAFADCKALKSLAIPENVTVINDFTFYGCSGLTELKIPAGVTSIGNQAFQNCSALTELVIPSGVTTIGDGAFSSCSGLTELIIPGNVTTIGEAAFAQCTGLTELILPNSVTSLGDYAFSTCDNVTYIKLSDKLTYLGGGTFMNCTGLKWLAIPKAVTNISDTCFVNCYNMECVTFMGSEEDVAGFVDYVPGRTKHYNGTCCVPEITLVLDDETGKPKISWEVRPCAMSYSVCRSATADGEYEVLATFARNSVTGTVSYVDETAPDNGHFYFVLAEAIDADASQSSERKNVDGKCSKPVLTPGNVYNTGKPVIFWKAVYGAQKYEVYRATSANGKYSKVKTTTDLLYADSKATAGKVYYYKVKAIAATSSKNSDFSQVLAVGCLCAQPSFKVSLTAATGQPSVTWSKVTGASKYEILRSTEAYGVYESLAVQTALSFKDTTAAPDTEYFYKVNTIASNPLCNSMDAEPKNIQTTCAQPVLRASSDPLTGIPTITWEAVEGAVSYEVSRSTKSKGSFTVLETTAEQSFVDSTAVGGKTYYYKVTAITASGAKSAVSSYKSAKCVCAAPVIATQTDAAKGKPQISWEKISGAKKYEVWRASSETGKAKKLTTTTKLTYIDTSASVGKTYFYKVKAVASSSSYNSAYSQILSCYTVCAQPVVKASINSTTGKAELSWSKITGASKYEILRSTAADGVFESLAIQTGTSYKDTAAAADTIYYYKVNAIASNPANNSVDGIAKEVTVGLAKPVIKAATEPVTGKPQITWEAVEGAVSYEIARATKKSGKYASIGTTAESEYLDVTAAVGKTYYYKVTAVGVNSTSAASSYKSTKCKCGQPVAAVELNESGKPVITWEKVEKAKKYEVYRATSETGKYSKVSTTTKLTYTDTKAASGKTYYYKVKAVASSSSYNSAYSPILSVQCP